MSQAFLYHPQVSIDLIKLLLEPVFPDRSSPNHFIYMHVVMFWPQSYLVLLNILDVIWGSKIRNQLQEWDDIGDI